jgi:hypothetical protein
MMTEIASQLASSQWTLRSGRGKGADQAFEAGVTDSSLKEIYLPQAGFNGAGPYSHFKVSEPTERVVQIARDHHPMYDRSSEYIQRLFNRNVNILLGEDADLPSHCGIYWHFLDNDIEEFGGTNHSLRIARTFNIPTFNIGIPSELEALINFINEFDS